MRLTAVGSREEGWCAVFSAEVQQLYSLYSCTHEPHLKEMLHWCSSFLPEVSKAKICMPLPRPTHLNPSGNLAVPSVVEGNEIAAAWLEK